MSDTEESVCDFHYSDDEDDAFEAVPPPAKRGRLDEDGHVASAASSPAADRSNNRLLAFDEVGSRKGQTITQDGYSWTVLAETQLGAMMTHTVDGIASLFALPFDEAALLLSAPSFGWKAERLEQALLDGEGDNDARHQAHVTAGEDPPLELDAEVVASLPGDEAAKAAAVAGLRARILEESRPQRAAAAGAAAGHASAAAATGTGSAVASGVVVTAASSPARGGGSSSSTNTSASNGGVGFSGGSVTGKRSRSTSTSGPSVSASSSVSSAASNASSGSGASAGGVCGGGAAHVHSAAGCGPLQSIPFTCPVTWEETPACCVDALPCGHWASNAAWRNLIVSAVTDGKEMMAASCPHGCGERLRPRMVLRHAPEHWHRYRQHFVRSFANSSRNYSFCPAPGCTSVIQYTAGGAVDVTCGGGDPASGLASPTVSSSAGGAALRASASSVGAAVAGSGPHVFCFKCKHLGSHRPAACEEVATWEAKADRSDGATATYLASNTKPCPKCSTRIERSSGCNKVICTKCSTAFCYMCLRYPFTKYHDYPNQAWSCSTEPDWGSMSADARELKEIAWFVTQAANHTETGAEIASEKTKAQLDECIMMLNDHLPLTDSDTGFLFDAVATIIKHRNMLKWSYVHAYSTAARIRQLQRTIADEKAKAAAELLAAASTSGILVAANKSSGSAGDNKNAAGAGVVARRAVLIVDDDEEVVIIDDGDEAAAADNSDEEDDEDDEEDDEDEDEEEVDEEDDDIGHDRNVVAGAAAAAAGGFDFVGDEVPPEVLAVIMEGEEDARRDRAARLLREQKEANATKATAAASAVVAAASAASESPRSVALRSMEAELKQLQVRQAIFTDSQKCLEGYVEVLSTMLQPQQLLKPVAGMAGVPSTVTGGGSAAAGAGGSGAAAAAGSGAAATAAAASTPSARGSAAATAASSGDVEAALAAFRKMRIEFTTFCGAVGTFSSKLLEDVDAEA